MALSWPAIVEGAEPVTRFRMAEEAEGWLMSTRAPWPMENPCQFTIALDVVCWIVIWFAEGVLMLTPPWTVEAPVGNSPAPAANEPVRAVPVRSSWSRGRTVRFMDDL
ncbi:hypothetical protein CFIICLFH_4672 [Methylobacterium goesingense]|nr:hypothetical protein CFIICLFH_4672 [Methylobacterium goesingense]